MEVCRQCQTIIILANNYNSRLPGGGGANRIQATGHPLLYVEEQSSVLSVCDGVCGGSGGGWACYHDN